MELGSTIVSIGPAQADGRFNVTEQHTASDGQVIERAYLCDADLDPEMVMREAAAIILARLEMREAARVAVVGIEVPWTKHQFLDRFTLDERKAIRRRAKVDENVQDFMEMLNASGGVFPTLAKPGLQYLAHVTGDITPARATEIGRADQ